jgi:hypothetical protein
MLTSVASVVSLSNSRCSAFDALPGKRWSSPATMRRTCKREALSSIPLLAMGYTSAIRSAGGQPSGCADMRSLLALEQCSCTRA